MRIRYLQHVPFEGLGSIAAWARSREHDVAAVRLFAGEQAPEPDAYDLLVVLGGPMNVDEEGRYAFLAPEKRALARAIEADKPIVGICLGAQLLARVLGARVVRSPHEEIGWLPVRFTEAAATSPLLEGVPPTLETFHWHGDMVELPAGAVLAAASDGCPAQAFLYGERVVGLQFHPEATPESVSLLVEHDGAELDAPGRPYVQSSEALLAPDRPYAANARVVAAIFDAIERGMR